MKSPLPATYTATTYNVKLGVWGGDITKFLQDCAIVNACRPKLDLYNSYDGWAMGALVSFSNVKPPAPPALPPPDNGFCFDSTKICVMGYYGTGEGVKFGPRIYVADMSTFVGLSQTNQVSETTPTHSSFVLSPELKGYYGFSQAGSWASAPKSQTATTNTYLAWRFVSKTDKPSFVSGTKINVWGVVDD